MLGDARPFTTIFSSATDMRFECGDFFYETKLIDGKYPDYERVIPATKITHKIAFASHLLLPILNTLGKSRPINLAVEQGEPGQDHGPHILTSDSVKGVTCVIMPMRADW
jgi:hypothetical protein